ncbi:hypothetical protein D3C86_1702310 [compost metagenome]
MRRSAEFKCIHQEAELLLRFLCREPEDFKHLTLQFFLEYPDRTSAHFNAIDYHIVCIRPYQAQVFIQQADILRFGAGERMVHGKPPVFFLAKFQQREIDHP